MPGGHLGMYKKRGLFMEWCRMTGWHGIMDCCIAEHWVWRALWLLMVLGGAFMATMQCFYMVGGFIQEDQWVTSISYMMPQEGRLRWPNMTICSIYSPPVPAFSDESALTKANISDADQGNITASMNRVAQVGSSGSNVVDGLNMFGVLAENGVLDKLNISNAGDQGNGTGPLVSDALKTGDKSSSDDDKASFDQCQSQIQECGTSDGMFRYLLSDQTGCCSKSKAFGPLCIGVHTELTFANQKTDSASSIYYIVQDEKARLGYAVNLYVGDLEKASGDYGTTFVVTPGTRTVISLVSEIYRVKQLNRIVNFGLLDLPCGRDPTDFEYFGTRRYTKDLCAKDCMVQWQMKFCGCSVNFTAVGLTKQRARRCATDQDHTCISQYYDSIRKLHNVATYDKRTITNEMIQFAKCADQCPDPCEYGRTEAQISSSLFQPETTQNNNDKSKPAPKQTMLDMSFLVNQQRVYEKSQRLTIDEFISNIGGCLGVWCGISVLSVVQIFYYLLRGCWHCVDLRLVKRVYPQKAPVYFHAHRHAKVLNLAGNFPKRGSV